MLTSEQLRQYLPWMLDILQELVEIESPTTDKAGTDRAGQYAADHMQILGATIERHAQDSVGDHWVGTWGDGNPSILMMVHLDTVHPLGTIERFPWTREDDRISGPGVFDMKASAAIALSAVKALQERDAFPDRRISLMFNSDEETGSHTSRALIQQLAKEHDLVLCLEPALPDGALKTWRKGIGMFELEVVGRPAHSGANPGDGVNAIHEMAVQIQRLAGLADAEAGTTLNIGLIKGGTRTNVIPARAWASIDVRFQSEAERERIASQFEQLTPSLPEAALHLTGEWNRPAMPRSPLIIEAFERAREITSSIGLELTEGGTGGGSDANFVAPMNVPVLDGLGAVGGGAHTEQEFILVSSLPQRVALLAALLAAW